MNSWLMDWSSEVERENVIAETPEQREGVVAEEPERLAEQPAADAGAGNPTGCAEVLHGTQAGTDTSVPEKRNVGRDRRLLPQIAKLGEKNRFFLAPMNNWGIMLWADDRNAVEAARDIAPWVLDHHAEILAELEVGSPMVRDWTVPKVVFVGLGAEGKILESHS